MTFSVVNNHVHNILICHDNLDLFSPNTAHMILIFKYFNGFVITIDYCVSFTLSCFNENLYIKRIQAYKKQYFYSLLQMKTMEAMNSVEVKSR